MTKHFYQYSKTGSEQCLKLKNALYGLCLRKCAFWQYLTKKLEAFGLKQSEFDPFLFVGEKSLCIEYVDDIIFWASNYDDIHELEILLRESGVDLEQKYDAAEFLGVTLDQDPNTGLLEMKQTGIIQQFI